MPVALKSVAGTSCFSHSRLRARRKACQNLNDRRRELACETMLPIAAIHQALEMMLRKLRPCPGGRSGSIRGLVNR